jgi:hypothetical protein
MQISGLSGSPGRPLFTSSQANPDGFALKTLENRGWITAQVANLWITAQGRAWVILAEQRYPPSKNNKAFQKYTPCACSFGSRMAGVQITSPRPLPFKGTGHRSLSPFVWEGLGDELFGQPPGLLRKFLITLRWTAAAGGQDAAWPLRDNPQGPFFIAAQP